MRATLMGIMAGAGLAYGILSAWSVPQDASAQRNRVAEGIESRADQILAVPGAVVDGQQSWMIVDSSQQTMASYQVDGKTGQVTLRCVRNFRWDLMLDDYSGTEPSPEKIRALLQSR